MTDPQVWVLIGVFAASVFGMLTWQTISFNRNLRVSLDGLDRSLSSRVDALREVMDTRFDALDARVTAVETRVTRIERKIDDLDRDVQALTRHVFGPDRP